MAELFLKETALLFVVWLAYKQVKVWLGWRALKKFGEQHGCGEAPTVPNALPGGIERYAIFLKGMKGLDFLEDVIRNRFNVMGCFTYRVFGLFDFSLVTTAEPENIQAILASNFTDFDLGPTRAEAFHDLLGHGIFTSEGAAWAHYRKQLKPQFSRDQVSDLEAADRHLQILFKAIPQEDAAGYIQSVDLQPLIYRFTMDVSTEFLFGESVNSQSTALHSLDSGNTKELQAEMTFAEAMNYAQEFIAYRWRLRGLYRFVSKKRFNEACKIVKDFGDRFVKIALDPNHKRNQAALVQKEKFVMLDAMLEETRDPIELRDQILHLLIAGRDTTSALLSWTILLLGRYPEEFIKLRAAIIENFGTESEPNQELTFASMKACKAITHVLYESMRLYPLLPLNGRMALKDTVLPTGGGPNRKQPIAIRKGEQVGYSTYVMHRRPDIWGPDSEEFVPARWQGRKLGWEFIPFSGGPRVCLGQQYALNEASFVIVKTLQRFDMIEAVDKGPILKGMSLTLSPLNGTVIKLHKASA